MSAVLGPTQIVYLPIPIVWTQAAGTVTRGLGADRGTVRGSIPPQPILKTIVTDRGTGAESSKPITAQDDSCESQIVLWALCAPDATAIQFDESQKA